MDDLGNKAESVQVVFVSVDPKRDTPEKIQQYVEHFNQEFIGLSGSMDELESIWNNMAFFAKKLNQIPRSVTLSTTQRAPI